MKSLISRFSPFLIYSFKSIYFLLYLHGTSFNVSYFHEYLKLFSDFIFDPGLFGSIFLNFQTFGIFLVIFFCR